MDATLSSTSFGQYREPDGVELSERVQRIGTSTGVKFVFHDTVEREENDAVEDESPIVPAVASTSERDSHVQHAK